MIICIAIWVRLIVARIISSRCGGVRQIAGCAAVWQNFGPIAALLQPKLLDAKYILSLRLAGQQRRNSPDHAIVDLRLRRLLNCAIATRKLIGMYGQIGDV